MEVNPLSQILGAEIKGIDVGELDNRTFSEIYKAFLEYHVLVFRDQDLPPHNQLAFARRFGELDIHIQKENQVLLDDLIKKDIVISKIP